MPSKNPLQHFTDIIESIDHIASFTAGLTFEQYEADIKTQWAVERALLIISEAAYRLGGDADLLCPGQPWHDIRNTGNVIRHGYDFLHDARIWNTVQADLPILRKAAENAVNRLKPQP